jgi:hypothetical protein
MRERERQAAVVEALRNLINDTRGILDDAISEAGDLIEEVRGSRRPHGKTPSAGWVEHELGRVVNEGGPRAAEAGKRLGEIRDLRGQLGDLHRELDAATGRDPRGGRPSRRLVQTRRGTWVPESELGLQSEYKAAAEQRGRPVEPVAARKVVIEPLTGAGRAGGTAGARSPGSGRGGIGGRGGRGGGFGFGAVAMEIMYPEESKQAKAQAEADEIAEKLARYDKEISDRLNKMRLDIAHLQLTKDASARVYMNVVYEVHHLFPLEVRLKSVKVTTQNLNDQRRYSTVLPWKGWATGGEYNVRRDVDEHTYSVEVSVYSEAELEHFANLSEEYQRHKRTLAMRPDDATAAERLAKVRKEIVDTFGADVWVLNL